MKNYLQHYSRTTTTLHTEVQLCLWVHRQVWCDKISIAVKSSKGIDEKSRFDKLATASSLSLLNILIKPVYVMI